MLWQLIYWECVYFAGKKLTVRSFLQMSLTEDKDVQVIEMDSPSPASSAISSSSSTTDSESASEGHEATALENIQQEDKEQLQVPEGEGEEGDGAEEGGDENERNGMVIFRRDLPAISRSASPFEIKEERCSGEEYPPSQRVYSSPSCSISAGLQRQCYELWDQFDSIGTEMIVTRRGR